MRQRVGWRLLDADSSAPGPWVLATTKGGSTVSVSPRDGASILPDSWSGLQRRDDRGLIDRVDQALGVLQGKWKVHLLFFMARGIHRHGKLLACLPGVSKKVMTDTLRALERDGLVARRVYAEVPVRVEYSLTPLGWSITEPVIALSEWGEAHAQEVAEARARSCKRDGSDGSKPVSFAAA
jgi:DNA-binding HxlR family transcriptional regulator